MSNFKVTLRDADGFKLVRSEHNSPAWTGRKVGKLLRDLEPGQKVEVELAR